MRRDLRSVVLKKPRCKARRGNRKVEVGMKWPRRENVKGKDEKTEEFRGQKGSRVRVRG